MTDLIHVPLRAKAAIDRKPFLRQLSSLVEHAPTTIKKSDPGFMGMIQIDLNAKRKHAVLSTWNRKWEPKTVSVFVHTQQDVVLVVPLQPLYETIRLAQRHVVFVFWGPRKTYSVLGDELAVAEVACFYQAEKECSRPDWVCTLYPYLGDVPKIRRTQHPSGTASQLASMKINSKKGKS